VRYPTFWGRYGKTATRLITFALVNVALGILILRLRLPSAGGIPALLALALLARGGYRLARTVLDLALPVGATGEVLWIQLWKAKPGGEDSPPVPVLYYLAVDDGTDDRTTAWAMPAELHGQCDVGDIVRFTARRWSRRVVGLTVVQPGRARALAAAGAAANDDTESLVAAVLGHRGGHAVASAVQAPSVAAGQLLTPEEVGRAVGHAVATANGAVAIGPVSMAVYSTVDGGRRAMQLVLTQGLPAQLAMRSRRAGQPLPGIGDEAYGGDGWAMARRGDRVLMIQAPGADPRFLPWLLQTATGRLPA